MRALHGLLQKCRTCGFDFEAFLRTAVEWRSMAATNRENSGIELDVWVGCHPEAHASGRKPQIEK